MNAHRVNTTTSVKLWLGTRRRLSGAASVAALMPFLSAALTGGALAGDALYTTTKDGTAVNANIYATSTDVYISGGPQNAKAAGLPDGTYYFQVTDPSGKTLLSTDPAICRQVTVVGGHIVGSSGPPCEHTDGTPNPANGTTPVQLFPFSSTPNAGNEYKAWLIPTGAATISASDPKVLTFANRDAKTDNFKVQTAITPPPPGSCQGAGSLAALVTGTSVVAYVPKGTWGAGAPGVSVVGVEGSSISTPVFTPSVVNSCAANSVTGKVVCTANNTDVYLFSGTSFSILTSGGGPGQINFTGGSCVNCNVAMDAVHNKAIIGLSIGGTATAGIPNFDGTPGFQVLDLNTSTFGAAFPSPAGAISEGTLFDTTRNLLLSAVEADFTPSGNNDFEIVDLTNSAAPKFYENGLSSAVPPVPPFTDLDSTAAECSTGIAVAPAEFTDPSQVLIADLTQIVLTPGVPGTWTAPSQFQTLSESSLSAGASGIAIAQDTHTGIITGEFGFGQPNGDSVTAIKLPATSGSGTPAITDWVTCHIRSGFANGDDPHTVTAYQSPNTGDAIALVANEGANTLVVIDLTNMLALPRVGHVCAAADLISAGVATTITIP